MEVLVGPTCGGDLRRQPACIGPSRWRHRGRLALACRSHDPIRLPSGTLWWLREGGIRGEDWVFGEQFVLQRARRPCRLGWAQHLGPHTPLLGPAPPWTLMPYWLLPSGDDAQEQAAAQEVGLSCGPEHRSPPATGPRWEPSHPRRTRMVRFTCRLCGTRTARWVNPHAWQRGSVFARCRGCEVVHKLVDNLEIFDEAGHDVFPPPSLREAFLGRELLDRARRLWDEGLWN